MDDRFVSLLEQLAAKLGVQAEMLLQSAASYMLMKSAVAVVIGLAILALGAWFHFVAYTKSKPHMVEGYSYPVREWEGEGLFFANASAAALMIIGLAVTATNAVDLFSAIHNPLFLAVKAIKSM